MKYKYGFIGCGNMGGALLKALLQTVDAKDIAVSDFRKEAVDEFKEQYGIIPADNNTVAKDADTFFLAVKPQFLADMIDGIKADVKKRNGNGLIITMAAGTSLEKVEKMFDCDFPIIRIMPNTPVSVGKGVILYTKNKFVTDEQEKQFVNDMRCAGKLDKLDEKYIDAASAVSGCGPAFVYMFIEAMADGAVECGLPRDKALQYAALTVEGAAKMVTESGKHPGALKDAVCSPGGTTIAGVHALEDGAFRANAMNAVTAAYDKTIELAKK